MSDQVALIRHLCTCGAGERREHTLRAARSLREQAVPELSRMVEGRKRTWLRSYSYADQIAGVEALAETLSPTALSYLESLYEPQIQTTSKPVPWIMQGSGDLPPRGDNMGQVEQYDYPRAWKALRKALGYEIWLHHRDEYEDVVATPEDQMQRSRERVASSEPHRVIRSAIARLRQSGPSA